MPDDTPSWSSLLDRIRAIVNTALTFYAYPHPQAHLSLPKPPTTHPTALMHKGMHHGYPDSPWIFIIQAIFAQSPIMSITSEQPQKADTTTRHKVSSNLISTVPHRLEGDTYRKLPVTPPPLLTPDSNTMLPQTLRQETAGNGPH